VISKVLALRLPGSVEEVLWMVDGLLLARDLRELQTCTPLYLMPDGKAARCPSYIKGTMCCMAAFVLGAQTSMGSAWASRSRRPLPVPAPHPDWQPLSLGSIATNPQPTAAASLSGLSRHPLSPGGPLHRPHHTGGHDWWPSTSSNPNPQSLSPISRHPANANNPANGQWAALLPSA
jgi:hypothetical protein